MKILIIGPSWVGDMVMSQSLYRTLKANNPDATIDVMAPDWCRPILSRMPEVNNVVAMPVGHGSLQLSVRRQLGKTLKQSGYDQAIVLPGSLKSALVPWFADIAKRSGWLGEMRYGLLNDYRKLDKVAFPLMVERYIALAFDKAEMTSAKALPQPLLYPALQVDNESTIAACQALGLNQDRPTLAICPGAEFGPAKRWPHYHYAQAVAQLIDTGWQVWIFGSGKDHPVGEEILAHLSDTQRTHCINLAGQTKLEQAVDLMASCKAAITNDSGLMHVAAAVGLPLVALYGPSSPDFTPPLTHQAKVIRLIDGYLKVRKGDGEQGYHQSLIDITPQMTLDALDELLAGQSCAS
ncbi:ADP-heptose--LPS heptosyltransferase RfaF [Photobacterium sanguinicancri]|uniref:lipopolysaccharide heptosyltransferase II n=1 Tax=Photobacterium sanguinicancri TaxID=875932 RepID=A0ABX4FUF2_9GAMM|nr:ADP-heptose--LPS heptosyltransferase RfaF [Photobacterium sanguinicancri]MDO6499392.1 ADP-heptose--LPS heptosyltransferase RfaF [Photobacterium sanguinicancri]OZS42508.1 ADP-heptose--LPS heptosyltransferase [Photobacterium sanguinicancri]